MNKSLHKLQLILFAGMFLFASCKKYGYNFNDGYEHGLETPTANIGNDTLTTDFSKLNVARIFPGLVGENEPRLKDYPVSIDLRFDYVKPVDIRVISTPEPWFSTGLYAPAGEPVTIEVPQEAAGLTAQIGGWIDNLYGTTNQKRDPLIYNQLQLVAGKNYIRNLYGGSLYIRANGNLQNGKVVTLKFSGAVKSPDFILGTSTDVAWNEEVKKSTVPWLQLRSSHIIFELPKYFIDKHPIQNPTMLMQEWERIITEDIYKFKRLDFSAADSMNAAPSLPVRVIMDVQPRLSYIRYGFPVVVQFDENLFTQEIAKVDLLKTRGAWRVMSEIGRNNITTFWRWSGFQDAVANLYSLKMANSIGKNYAMLNDSLTSAVNIGLQYAAKTKDYRASFVRDIPRFSNSELIKLVPFMQLFDTYSYGMMGYIDKIARYDIRTVLSEQQKVDFLYKYTSEYAKTDLEPFYTQWGIYVSQDVKNSVAAQYPRLEKDIYNYNPITKQGGNGTVPQPSKIIQRTTWKIIDFCCQESESGLYVSNMLDGDLNTIWHSLYRLLYPSDAHLPHYMVFDMGQFYDVSGFFYQNGTSMWRPKTMNVYVSSDNINWIRATPKGIVGSNDNQIYRQYNFDQVFKNIRFVKYEINDVHSPSSNNACSTAEFGMIKA